MISLPSLPVLPAQLLNRRGTFSLRHRCPVFVFPSLVRGATIKAGLERRAFFEKSVTLTFEKKTRGGAGRKPAGLLCCALSNMINLPRGHFCFVFFLNLFNFTVQSVKKET